MSTENMMQKLKESNSGSPAIQKKAKLFLKKLGKYNGKPIGEIAEAKLNIMFYKLMLKKIEGSILIVLKADPDMIKMMNGLENSLKQNQATLECLRYLNKAEKADRKIRLRVKAGKETMDEPIIDSL